ncbi:MAG: hypothetical protein MUC87_20440 [Bacteroidia bacterium]|jgi:hypothetical protein|nr:hypothetical protein [Bacteroidia bacterium]
MEIPTNTALPIFEPNQVLTSTNLNRMRTYLDQQNRLTRVRLSGTGIVCGLQINWNGTTISITKGYGITTEGYLLGIDNVKAFNRIKEWKDPANPDYQFGKSLPNDALDTSPVTFPKQGPLDSARSSVYELHNVLADGMPISGTITNLQEWAVVIHYEITDEDLRSCSTSNCDNKGKLRSGALRFLLVNISQLPTPSASGNISFPNLPIAMPLINMRRLPGSVLFNANTPADLLGGYQTEVINRQKVVLSTWLTTAFSQFGGVFGLTPPASAQAALNTIDTGVLYRQHIVDAMQHITMACNDFAIAAGSFSTDCGYLPGNYPRHLTLGLMEVPSGQGDGYRHNFVAVRSGSGSTQRNARTLFERVLYLIQDFKKLPASNSVNNIRITPGGWSPQQLAERAIPFYYNPDENSNRIAKLWYPARSALGLWSNHLSYYNSHDSGNPVSWYDQAQSWSLQQTPFLRIEGFGGLPYPEVITKIEQLKRQHNLSFNVIALKINNDGVRAGKDKLCGFEDIQEDYVLARFFLINFFNELIDTLNMIVKDAAVLIISNQPASGNEEVINEEIQPEGDAMRSSSGSPSRVAAPGNEPPAKIDLQQIQNWLDFIKDLEDKRDQFNEILPSCVYDFNYVDFRDLYKKYIDELIDFALRLGIIDSFRDSIDKSESMSLTQKTVAKNLISIVTGRIVYLLFDSIFYTKFYRVYYRFKLREYRRSKFFRLKTFAQARPGMEHLGGTFQGGTFILVYEAEDDSEIIIDPPVRTDIYREPVEYTPLGSFENFK